MRTEGGEALVLEAAAVPEGLAALEAFGEPFAYEADEIARGGLFVMLGHDGQARIERGFIRPEDAAPEPEAEEAASEEVAQAEDTPEDPTPA